MFLGTQGIGTQRIFRKHISGYTNHTDILDKTKE